MHVSQDVYTLYIQCTLHDLCSSRCLKLLARLQVLVSLWPVLSSDTGCEQTPKRGKSIVDLLSNWRRWWSTIEAKRLVLVQFVWYEFSIHTPQMGLDEQLQIGIHAMAWGLHHALAQTSSVCSNCHEVAWHQHWQIKMMWVTCISEHFLWQIYQMLHLSQFGFISVQVFSVF